MLSHFSFVPLYATLWTVDPRWCFWIVVLEKTLESPLDYKESKPVNPKGNQSWVFIGRTDTEAKIQNYGHLMRRTDSLEKTLMLGKIEGKRRRGQQRMRWLDHWLNGHEFEQAPGVGDGHGSLVCYIPWGCKELDRTEQLNWTEPRVSWIYLMILTMPCILSLKFSSLHNIQQLSLVETPWETPKHSFLLLEVKE